MTPLYRIVEARPGDLSVAARHRARCCQPPCRACARVRTHRDGRPRSTGNGPRHGRLWVALTDDVPVGFAHVAVIAPHVAHLEEIDVHPEHGRRGLGRGLVMAVCGWAATAGYREVTLTTFRDPPWNMPFWNMPFYARLGFEVIPIQELSPALCLVVDDETRRGLDLTRRVAMRRSCAP
jgi:GNAT superfamily N-acetyltransferase